MKKSFFLVLVCICSLAMAAIVPAMADVMPGRFRLEPMARGLTNPHGVALAPDGRIFYLERTTGKVRIVQNGKLLTDPLVTVSVPASSPEGGLLAIALHPDFTKNGYLYLYYTKALNQKNRISRFTAFGNTASNEYVVLDDIGPAAVGLGEDNGGALAFGTDGNLYATVGVMENDPLAQDDNSYLGKVLQISFFSNGNVNQIVKFAKGFRNQAAIAVNKNTGTIYVTDNYDGEPGASCDEVDVVQSGIDYGWNGALDTCSTPGLPPSPMQDITPQITTSGLVAYTGSKYQGFCTNHTGWDCTADSGCGECQAIPGKACGSGADCGTCANNPALECTGPTCAACTLHPDWYCQVPANCRYCSKDSTKHCNSDQECGGGGSKCTGTDSCTAIGACNAGTCVGHACGVMPGTLLVAGQNPTNTKIVRDFVTGTGLDTLTASTDFYVPAGSNCPVGLRALAEGKDGWIYATADDATVPSRAGIYRIVNDSERGAAAAPREVSGSPYVRMTLDRNKTTGAITFYWEDLKKDAWACSPDTPGLPSGTVAHCNPGAGFKSAKYTLWSGGLTTPFAYNHTGNDLDSTAVLSYNDALVSYTLGAPPEGNQYYLVSARHADLEGSLGVRETSGVPAGERPGYTTTDLCSTIGYGTAAHDLNKCSGDWPHAYPDQDGRLWNMSDLRGKVVVMSMMQYG